jgi:lipopolysaccharide/colanic/teichoic acid biosynthesis glycosyltransferase
VKRLFDFTLALIGLLFIFPILIIVAILIKIDSKGPVFYKQVRVGRNNLDFKIFKFRTMKPDSDKLGLLTVGGKDNRITRVGYYLRKYKLDELPQLINVVLGDMSFVGPRPEVRKYVDLYSQEQRKVLDVRPGITDNASIEFKNENELLAQQENPNQYYIDHIMPKKININLTYLKERKSIFNDFQVILKTIFGIFG